MAMKHQPKEEAGLLTSPEARRLSTQVMGLSDGTLYGALSQYPVLDYNNVRSAASAAIIYVDNLARGAGQRLSEVELLRRAARELDALYNNSPVAGMSRPEGSSNDILAARDVLLMMANYRQQPVSQRDRDLSELTPRRS